MKKTFNFIWLWLRRAILTAFGIIALSSGSRVSAQEPELPISADEATAIAIDAYIYV